MTATRAFGPFAEVPSELIKSTGFNCRIYRHPVEHLAQKHPFVVPRMLIHGCECGCICVWEDEVNIKRKIWRSVIALLQRSGAKVLLVNWDQPLDESFSGVN